MILLTVNETVRYFKIFIENFCNFKFKVERQIETINMFYDNDRFQESLDALGESINTLIYFIKINFFF